MSDETQAIRDIKDGAAMINAQLAADGCAPYDFKGATLYKPVLVQLMVVRPEGGRKRVDFVVKFPEQEGDIAVFSPSSAQFSLYFGGSAGKDARSRLLPHDGSAVQAMEPGGFVRAEGIVRHWGDGWSIAWK